MKNINLNFSPKKLQNSPGSPQIMTNTTMKKGKSFLFRLLSDLWQFETFCIISIQNLKCCRCSIMHTVPRSLLCIAWKKQSNLCPVPNVSLGCLCLDVKRLKLGVTQRTNLSDQVPNI